jgi:hypothetical protein
MKSSRRFWNWKGRFVSTYCANNANHNRSDGCKRYIVRAGETLTAFLELEAAIRTGSNIPVSLGCPMQPSPISANLLLDYANQWFALWCFTPPCC